MSVWFLKLHRWIAVVFALPLLAVIGTGLVLSVEPSLVMFSTGGELTPARLGAILAQHDPRGEARGIVYRGYDHTLTIGGGRGRAGTVVDVRSGQTVTGPGLLAATLTTARRMHETLLLDARWLVTASTVVMLILAVLGVLMGLPRFSNTLSGWHKGLAWCLLPLIVLSPLTGLFLAMGITFTGPRAEAGGRASEPMKLGTAIEIIARQHDISALMWIREQRGQTVARIVENGEYRVYSVTPQGAVPVQRNWPRLWHEGNFAGHWSAIMNLVTSVAMLGLLGTGIWMWAARQLARRARSARTSPA